MSHRSQRRLNPRKLLLSKWTAVSPQQQEKHFIVTQVVEPDTPEAPIESVVLQAVMTRRDRVVAWRDLTNADCWHQGWH